MKFLRPNGQPGKAGLPGARVHTTHSPVGVKVKHLLRHVSKGVRQLAVLQLHQPIDPMDLPGGSGVGVGSVVRRGGGDAATGVSDTQENTPTNSTAPAPLVCTQQGPSHPAAHLAAMLDQQLGHLPELPSHGVLHTHRQQGQGGGRAGRPPHGERRHGKGVAGWLGATPAAAPPSSSTSSHSVSPPKSRHTHTTRWVAPPRAGSA